MFVDIENYKSPLAIENLLIPYKRGRLSQDKKSYLPKEPISPDVCWEVLRSTNAPRSIKDMLSCIAELPPSEQAQFKDVVLSIFDNREQPETIWKLAEKLAQTHDFQDELNDTKELQKGIFYYSTSKLSKGVVTDKCFIDKKFLLQDYEAIVCLTSEKVKFDYLRDFPKTVDIRSSRWVEFERCNFKNVETLRFSNGTDVDFCGSENFPAHLDLSSCRPVDFEACNLIGVQLIIFDENTSVNFNKACHLPQNLDLSNCYEVFLCDVNLEGVHSIQFQNDATVYLLNATNLPPQLDFSHCGKIDLQGANLDKVQRLIFKNSKQLQDSNAKIPENWNGKVVFSDASLMAKMKNFLQKKFR